MSFMTDLEHQGSAELTKEEKNWGVYCHLAALLGFIVPLGGNFIGPIVVWLLKKDEYPLVEDQGKEVLNFQITLLLMSIVAGILVTVLIGAFLLWVLPIYFLILTVVGAVKASEGKRYRYPFTLRLIK